MNKLLLKQEVTNKKDSYQDEDILCCPLTLEKFEEHTVTTYGNTYEYAAILEHIKDVGKFDPLNREYLDEKMIFPNRKIKELL